MGAGQQAMFMINPFVFGGGGGDVPDTLSDIWEWWEPSRESGYVDGDPLSGLTGQANSRNMTMQVGNNSHPKYQTNELNGLAIALLRSGRCRGRSVFLLA
jgi:hypothetical protein